MDWHSRPCGHATCQGELDLDFLWSPAMYPSRSVPPGPARSDATAAVRLPLTAVNTSPGGGRNATGAMERFRSIRLTPIQTSRLRNIPDARSTQNCGPRFGALGDEGLLDLLVDGSPSRNTLLKSPGLQGLEAYAPSPPPRPEGAQAARAESKWVSRMVQREARGASASGPGVYTSPDLSDPQVLQRIQGNIVNTIHEVAGALTPYELGVAMGGVRMDPRVRDEFLTQWMNAELTRENPTPHLLRGFGCALEGRSSAEGDLACDGEFMKAFLECAARSAAASSTCTRARNVYVFIALLATLLAGGERLDANALERLLGRLAESGARIVLLPDMDLMQEVLFAVAQGAGGESLAPDALSVLMQHVVAAQRPDFLQARLHAVVQAVGGDGMQTQARATLLFVVTAAACLSEDQRRAMVWHLTPLRGRFQYGVRHLLHHARELSGLQICRLMHALCDEAQRRWAAPGGRGRGDGAHRIRVAAIAEEIVGVGQPGTHREIPGESLLTIPTVDRFPDATVVMLACAYARARALPVNEESTEALICEFKPAIDARLQDDHGRQQNLAGMGVFLACAPRTVMQARALTSGQRRALLEAALRMPEALGGKTAREVLEDVFRADAFDRGSERWLMWEARFQQAASQLSLVDFSRVRDWLCEDMSRLRLTGETFEAALECLSRIYAAASHAADRAPPLQEQTLDRPPEAVLRGARTAGHRFLAKEHPSDDAVTDRKSAFSP